LGGCADGLRAAIETNMNKMQIRLIRECGAVLIKVCQYRADQNKLIKTV
jgi:hypothetical protein